MVKKSNNSRLSSNNLSSRQILRKAAAARPASSSARHGKHRRKKKRSIKMSPWLFAGIFAAAVLLMLVLVRPFHFGGERGAKVPPGSWRYGLDISHNNEGPIVWDSLYVMTDRRRRTVQDPFKASEIKPVSFVYIKATEGATMKDPDFRENWKNAGHANVRRGAYHFFRSSKDGELQARNFIETVGKMRLHDLPPVLDIETIHRGCTKELLNQRALQWLRAIESHYGKKPIVYASSSFIKDNLSEEVTNEYPIWVAHYGRSKPEWDTWMIWQVTDRAIVKGIPDPVDLDVMEIK